MTIPHPIPYQGSKRNLAAQILRYIPKDTNWLIEPFAGSAAISLASAATGIGKRYLINDINAPLMGLWQAIIEQPEHLAKHYHNLWQAQLGHERLFYDRVRERFNISYRPHYFLYLLARCVKAAVRYNADGAFNQSPDNRRKGRRPETMARDIYGASRILEGKTRITTADYETIFQVAGKQDVIYMDPPYQGVCGTRDPRYISGMAHQRFVQVLHHLNERGISYLLSYDGHRGNKHYGTGLPETLELRRLELDAGRSSQATLLGRQERSIESLYLSPALTQRLGQVEPIENLPEQLQLFGEPV